MSRVFAYARVSTLQQDTENQIKEISAAGFKIEPHRIIKETVSGSVPISERKGFTRLLDKMERGDTLIVTKLDRLGRNLIDVSITVEKLGKIGIKIHCLALGGMDLTSSAGKMTMGVINAAAQFERDLLIERTQMGLARAKSQGKKLGRPRALSEAKREQVIKYLAEGQSFSSIARQFGVSRFNIANINKAEQTKIVARKTNLFASSAAENIGDLEKANCDAERIIQPTSMAKQNPDTSNHLPSCKDYTFSEMNLKYKFSYKLTK